VAERQIEVGDHPESICMSRATAQAMLWATTEAPDAALGADHRQYLADRFGIGGVEQSLADRCAPQSMVVDRRDHRSR